MSNSDLKLRAIEVRDEILNEQNTAFRVGQLLVDVIENLGIDTAVLDKRYLRKDIDDTAHGVIQFDSLAKSTIFSDGYDGKGWMLTGAGNAWLDQVQVRKRLLFGKGIGTPVFISGFPYGVGADLSSYIRTNAAGVDETKWRLELDDIIVRGKLRVFEMVVSQLRGENDNVIFAGMMKVDHYDPDTGKIYLDTDQGVLYNPFRSGDILMMQRYGGMPSEGNQYNVIKQYELRVTEVGVGITTDPQKRLDWIQFSNFVGDLEDIALGDVLTRVDSVTDSTRKGVIKITSIDEVGAPYIDVVYGMKTDPNFPVKARFGNLTGIRTLNNIDLTGIFGGYLQGAVIENSRIYLENGMTVEQNFTVMNGELNSQISSLQDLLATDEGNILKNSQFSRNTYYWVTDNTISVFSVGSELLWFNNNYYANKTNVADIYTDKTKKVLRLRNAGILQKNPFFDFHDVPEEERKAIYTASFVYRGLVAGMLKMGVVGSPLYKELTFTPSDEYVRYDITGEWDGLGDFKIEATGEVLISSLKLFNDELSNLSVKLETQIFQNAYEISLRATKLYVDNQDGTITREMQSKFTVTAQQISGIVYDINYIENTIASAGWITTAQGNQFWASKSLENGDVIKSYINQTAGAIKISANQLQLEGAVTFSMLNTTTQNIINAKLSGTITETSAIINGYTFIAGGYLNTTYAVVQEIKATRGTIAGFKIEGTSLTNAGFNNDAAVIFRNDIYGVFAGIGGNILPASSGARGVARFENHDTTGWLGLANYALIVSAKNSGYDRNHAIAMMNGFISGFALKPTHVQTNNYSITNADTYISCYNTSAITIWLPNPPNGGKMVFIRQMNGSGVTVNGNGINIHNRAGLGQTTINIGSDGDMGLFFYDGSYWNYQFLGRQ